MLIRHTGDYTWEDVPVLAYKEENLTCFKSVTRQVLINAVPQLPCQLRYFEVAPGGYSTLEKHEHVHFVVIFHGEGRALIDGKVHTVKEKDVIFIPSLTWHQFRAGEDSPLGFLCLVAEDRDRPVLPTSEDLTVLRENSSIADFIRS
ncbi:MAG: cupin domain-containing protein [Pelosinus sp.]|nr:cupin domain-containing protein [Pelosinus sp.]